MTERWYEQENDNRRPLPLKRLNINNTMLLDEGLAELLPLLAGPAFGNLKFLHINTTRLTEACASALTEFLASQFPEGRRLLIEMRMLNIRNIAMRSKVDGKKVNPMEKFKREVQAARKARARANFVIKM